MDERIEKAILALLEERAGSICPSEAARAVDPDDWRDRMEDVRSAGRRLADQGRLEVCQGGEPVDPEAARGPIRYVLKR